MSSFWDHGSDLLAELDAMARQALREAVFHYFPTYGTPFRLVENARVWDRDGYFYWVGISDLDDGPLYKWIWLNHFDIPSGWQIHHIDWNKYNNFLSNLLAVPRDLHSRFHFDDGIALVKEWKTSLVPVNYSQYDLYFWDKSLQEKYTPDGRPVAVIYELPPGSFLPEIARPDSLVCAGKGIFEGGPSGRLHAETLAVLETGGRIRCYRARDPLAMEGDEKYALPVSRLREVLYSQALWPKKLEDQVRIYLPSDPPVQIP